MENTVVRPLAEARHALTSLGHPSRQPLPRRPSSRPSRLEKWFVERALKALGSPPLAVRFWDDATISLVPEDAIQFVFVFHDRLTLWSVLLDPWGKFGEAYCRSRLEVLGDFASAIRCVFRFRSAGSPAISVGSLLAMLRRNTISRSRKNVWHHYDIGNQFFQLWLDQQMVYTCAYFPRPAMTLEDAQRAKMDHICRKLDLRAGQLVLEAGCGWGALALHMARYYGVKVKAYNVSHEQIDYARGEARRQGLAEQVELVEADWREMNTPCDVFVSVGMLEHVGLRNYKLLGEVIHRCLKEDGRALLHSIGQNHPAPVNPWIQRRIFPGAYPPSLRQMMQIIEPHDFSVLDVENLRLHYAQTLEHWLERYEQNVAVVRQMFDEYFVRMWRLYLCGSMAGFETGQLQLFQLLFCRGQNNNVPRTRANWYEAEMRNHAAP